MPLKMVQRREGEVAAAEALAWEVKPWLEQQIPQS